MEASHSASPSGFVIGTGTMPGNDFTDYGEIACSGFNMLFVAQRNGCRYLLKGLKPQYRQSPLYQMQMDKEYRLCQRLQHENIVQVYGLEEDPVAGRCIVMEYVEGSNLRQWLATHPSARRRHKVFSQLLAALSYCHAMQVVHCDLKPSNVMVTSQGEYVKLIDFGLSDADSYLVLKQPGGSDGYRAPEQDRGETPDARTDIYALGRLMGQLFPRRCLLLRWRCLRNNPARRPQSIDEVARSYRFWRTTPWAALILALLLAILLPLPLSNRPTQPAPPQGPTVEATLDVQPQPAASTDPATTTAAPAVNYDSLLYQKLQHIYLTEIDHCLNDETYTYDPLSEVSRRCQLAVHQLQGQAPRELHSHLLTESEQLQHSLNEQFSQRLHQCRIAVALRNR